jgi:hypothetical protein
MRKSSRLFARADATMPLIDDRVLFDATVICGAFVKPDGVNYKLLELADDGLIDAFTTDVAAYEFVYNAYKGTLTRGVPVEPELLSEFLDGFPHLFDPETTPRVSIRRNVIERVWMLGKPVGQVVYELTGRQRTDLLTRLRDQRIVGVDDFDPSDLHLLVAAVEQGADVVCTSNTSDLRQSAYGSDPHRDSRGALSRDRQRLRPRLVPLHHEPIAESLASMARIFVRSRALERSMARRFRLTQIRQTQRPRVASAVHQNGGTPRTRLSSRWLKERVPSGHVHNNRQHNHGETGEPYPARTTIGAGLSRRDRGSR